MSILRSAALRFLSGQGAVSRIMKRSESATACSGYETLDVTHPSPFVTRVQLNRPSKSNAMNIAFWREIKECFNGLNSDPDCRVVLLTGAGKNFTAGLDLQEFGPSFMSTMSKDEGQDGARKSFKSLDMIRSMQESFTSLEKCTKPVVAVIQGACIGGGIDMISACDIRIASHDAYFQIKEVDIGLAADVGTLQRLPKIVGGDSLVRELVYTARKFSADEALRMGMLSAVHKDRETAESAGLDLAKVIASKSPVAIQGSKVNLVYSRDHPVPDSLEYAVVWNSAMLQSDDLLQAMQGAMNKETPVFSKL